MALTLEDLPDDTATLKQMILELLASLHQERHDKEKIRHRLELLLHRLYGRRTERLDPNQLLLFEESPTAEQPPAPPDAGCPGAADAEPTPGPAPKRRKARPHGRRPLPDHLQREVREYELTEEQRRCSCGEIRVEIGVEQSEQLDWKPEPLFVIQHRVHKYACLKCAQASAESSPPAAQVGDSSDTSSSTSESADPPGVGPVVVSADRPPAPIAKGLPAAGLLACVIVNKFADHLPLYRQESIFERQGVFLCRSTTCDWLAACADALRPLYQVMVAEVLQSSWLHTDDTPVKNQRPQAGATATSRLWGYLGDRHHPYNVFDYTASRKRDGPQTFLKTYRGYLHADAFSGYDGLYLPVGDGGESAIVEVACNAHARRKFYEARGSDALRSHRALSYYRQLYELERVARDWTDEQRLRMRRELALPILEQFKSWLDEQRPQVLPKSPMAEAINYALNQWAALVRYTEAGYLSIDNNAAEREMKRIALGRRNWLFFGSDRGGRTAAILMSFTSSCARLGVEPWSYLRDVLERLPATSAEGLSELLPDRWQAARTQPSQAEPVLSESHEGEVSSI